MRRAPHASSFALLPAVFALLAPSFAHAASEEGMSEQAIASRTSGARFQMGALGFAHVREVSTSVGSDKEPGTIAPGGLLGVVWRVDAWELGPPFASPTSKSRRTRARVAPA